MKAPLPKGQDYSRVKNLIEKNDLHTICTSGNCPNRGECWNAGTATFMILGEKCTRNCRFCYVSAVMPDPVDWDEPRRVAESIKTLELKHAVITSVARDDLPDQGAKFWNKTIREIKNLNPGTTLEVLIPDLGAKHDLLDTIVEAKPEVISHNIETVRRITPRIRSMATYDKSLTALQYLAESGCIVKSGLMLGLGEFKDEVIATMQDLYGAGVEVLTIGQYLPPSERHAKLEEYVKPEVFKDLKKIGLEMGFKFVESGPMVRSSYHAERHVYREVY